MEKLYKSLLVFLFVICSNKIAYCTHGIALEIQYKRIGLNEYAVQINSYTKFRTAFDPDTLTISWGDGSSDVLQRSNGNGVFIGLPKDSVKLNIFKATHVYAGPSNYVMKVELRDRVHDLCNVQNGDSRYLSTVITDTIFIQDISIFGLNQGPVFVNPPILYANSNDTFVYNPLAVDLEGDSIAYELMFPLGRRQNDPISNLPGYTFPDQSIPGPNNKFSINSKTGEIKWITPQKCPCIFVIAVRITEYRKGIKLSTMIRDMQIFTTCENNDPPQINKPNDTCIRVGDNLNINVTATDPNLIGLVKRDLVYLTALGAPFIFNSPIATFDSPAVGNPVAAMFRWTPTCDFIRKNPYDVLLKAHDDYTINGTTRFLYDEELWKINVLPAEPKLLTGTTQGRKVVLNWQNPYKCFDHSEFEGFSIWRKSGCDSFLPNYCEIGAAQRGYTKIADKIKAYTYTDLTARTGQKYSYRVVANFAKRSLGGGQIIEESLSAPSNEVCIELKLDIPVMLNVDIQTTNTATGQVFVRWAKPKVTAGNLDTNFNPGPYSFKLYRSDGQTGNSFALIKTTTPAPFYLANDTSFIDQNQNTEGKSFSYKVGFFGKNNDSIGESDIASSIRLSSQPKNQSLLLSWSEVVPWTNYEYDIYRQDFNKIAPFNFIKRVQSLSYLDTLLINNSTYCYYVEAHGTYNNPQYAAPLVNKSQIWCDKPQDRVPPCPPTITVTNDCGLYIDQAWKNEQYINYIKWAIEGDEACREGLTRYHLYYTADSTKPYTLLDSFGANTNSFNQIMVNNLKGCYKITATDQAGNTSKFSNSFCIDNCPFYNLPNTFTPNGDGSNDLYTPFKPYRFVTKIDLKIYNRWGNLVYETTDPSINWDGVDAFAGKALNEGVYMYSGSYFINTLGGEIKKPLPGNKNGGGYIHLFRGK